MKKFLSLAFVLLALLFPLAAHSTGDTHTTTVMIYMCGSNLESQYGLATRDIYEMISSGYAPRQTNVVLMTGGASQWMSSSLSAEGSGIYQLRGSSFLPVWEGDMVNMGQSETLSFFLDTVHAKFQTERYMLIFWNHGGGPIKGVCWDENYNKDSLMISEIVAGLEGSAFRDQPLDMIGFDACLMGSVETAWQLAPYARYMVASEETEPGSGWNYSFLKGMEKEASLEDTGRRIVDLYIDSADPEAGYHLTLSLIDLHKIQTVIASMDQFFTDLNSRMTPSMFLDMSSLRHYAQGFGRDFRAEESSDYDLVDMVSLTDAFSKYDLPSGQTLRTALEEAVLYHRSTQEGSHGLSVYFPYFNLGSSLKSSLAVYDQLQFCPGYTSYIKTFQQYMTSDSLVNWAGMTPVVSRDGDGFIVSLPLTQEQQADLVSAKLVVFESSFTPGSANGFYDRVYGAANVTLSGGSLQAPYNDECIQVNYSTEDGVDTFSGSLPFLLLDSGAYRLPVLAANLKPNYIGKASEDEPGVSHMLQLTLAPADDQGQLHTSSVQFYDSMTDSYTSRTNDSPENYQYLHFISSAKVIQRKNGLILPYEQWTTETSSGVSLEENFSIPTASDLSFHLSKEPARLRYAAFEITDSRNNTFTTELALIRPLEEVTLYTRTFSLPDPWIDINCTLAATSPYTMTLLIELVNHTGDSFSFSIFDPLINGEEAPADDVALSLWELPAQSASSTYLTFNIFDTAVTDAAFSYIQSLQFDLVLNDGPTGYYLGTIEGLSLSPHVSFAELQEFFR